MQVSPSGGGNISLGNLFVEGPEMIESLRFLELGVMYKIVVVCDNRFQHNRKRKVSGGGST